MLAELGITDDPLAAARAAQFRQNNPDAQFSKDLDTLDQLPDKTTAAAKTLATSVGGRLDFLLFRPETVEQTADSQYVIKGNFTNLGVIAEEDPDSYSKLASYQQFLELSQYLPENLDEAKACYDAFTEADTALKAAKASGAPADQIASLQAEYALAQKAVIDSLVDSKQSAMQAIQNGARDVYDAMTPAEKALLDNMYSPELLADMLHGDILDFPMIDKDGKPLLGKDGKPLPQTFANMSSAAELENDAYYALYQLSIDSGAATIAIDQYAEKLGVSRSELMLAYQKAVTAAAGLEGKEASSMLYATFGNELGRLGLTPDDLSQDDFYKFVDNAVLANLHDDIRVQTQTRHMIVAIGATPSLLQELINSRSISDITFDDIYSELQKVDGVPSQDDANKNLLQMYGNAFNNSTDAEKKLFLDTLVDKDMSAEEKEAIINSLVDKYRYGAGGLSSSLAKVALSVVSGDAAAIIELPDSVRTDIEEIKALMDRYNTVTPEVVSKDEMAAVMTALSIGGDKLLDIAGIEKAFAANNIKYTADNKLDEQEITAALALLPQNKSKGEELGVS